VFRRISVISVIVALFLAARLSAAEPKVYVILWLDTEDYILPASDDAAKRLAEWLTAEKIRATFKVVGEKARTLERRGREDVIASLKKHEIGYHSNWHSVPPTPAQYLNELGWDEGVAEFDRRERPGFDDVTRIFGQKPTCYGQPGSSWAPQSFGALKNWGVPVYLDGGGHVDLDNKPLYFCGLLKLYKIDIIRTRLGGADDLAQTQERFAVAQKRLRDEGGGIISIIYHPCEFVHKEFWDGVNFRGGANPPREEWKLPRQKSADETESAFRNFKDYMRFIRRFEDVQFITASEAATIWRDEARTHRFTPDEIRTIAANVGNEANYQRRGSVTLSAAEVLELLVQWLNRRFEGARSPPAMMLSERTPLGPTATRPAFDKTITAPIHDFRQAVACVADSMERHGRVPSTVWVGSSGVSPEAFLVATAKLVVHMMDGGDLPAVIEINPAPLSAAKHVADDDPRLWRWVIFPPGFRAPQVMEIAKRQAWTIKPAVMH
jgi:hypothetical protein